jgi:hypothetical protein
LKSFSPEDAVGGPCRRSQPKPWLKWLLVVHVFLPAMHAGARPPESVLQEPTARDVAFDDGTALAVEWVTTLSDNFQVLVVRHSTNGGTDTIGRFPAPQRQVIDRQVRPDEGYRYELELYDDLGFLASRVNTPAYVFPKANWFDRARLGECIIILLLFVVILWLTLRRKEVYVRPIAGLTAMEEAIGRAVEMGRPVLFSAGWGAQLDKPTTMAAMNIFGWLAGKAAAYDARLTFPSHDAVIMAAAQESARTAAQLEGRPDWYRAEDIFYVTGSQFGYAAALDGIMEREQPAANLWLGTFAAESLILAETGNRIGAVQIAGTDSTIQLAFFLVTCDYTLIGEEVFAASAYLTRDPLVLGGLLAQDLLKIAVSAAVVVGLLGALFEWTAIGDWLRSL